MSEKSKSGTETRDHLRMERKNWSEDHAALMVSICLWWRTTTDALVRLRGKNLRTNIKRRFDLAVEEGVQGMPRDTLVHGQPSEGAILEGHDDWDCVLDLEAEGLIEVSEVDFSVVRPREDGWALSTAACVWRAKGREMSEFPAHEIPRALCRAGHYGRQQDMLEKLCKRMVENNLKVEQLDEMLGLQAGSIVAVIKGERSFDELILAAPWHLTPIDVDMFVYNAYAERNRNGEGNEVERAEETDDPLTLRSIDEVDVRTQWKSCLKMENINTIRDLVALTPGELMQVPNLGAKAVEAITAWVTANGMRLGTRL